MILFLSMNPNFNKNIFFFFSFFFFLGGGGGGGLVSVIVFAKNPNLKKRLGGGVFAKNPNLKKRLGGGGVFLQSIQI